eukprot:CAMPEP_0119541558 /NCGR_PEP_ID=MMETSP1344-20130328/53035_1 /TAXON_ID=236787 /ORGANISM="Florenciella parvula, Strain CCMP2471" /LENGTH=75 /DNA_ID=CAMNT_0007585561 /DNA_START=36 /DNA_END=259 /DNA_ORIENTATION=+
MPLACAWPRLASFHRLIVTIHHPKLFALDPRPGTPPLLTPVDQAARTRLGITSTTASTTASTSTSTSTSTSASAG